MTTLFRIMTETTGVTRRRRIRYHQAAAQRYRHTMIKILSIPTRDQGLHEFTTEAESAVQAAGLRHGQSTLFIRHTSASLLIQENAGSDARRDLEAWLNRPVKEGESQLFAHSGRFRRHAVQYQSSG
jgi:thiamine phosphate synthase YjbQ (UPF0047 family)